MMARMRPRNRPGWMALALAVALAGCQAAATPTPSAPPEPTPTPSPATAEEVITAFLALTTDPALTMHVVEDGKVTVALAGTTDDVRIAFDMDIRGEDGHGSAVIDTGPSDVTFDMLLIANKAYVDDNGTWTEVPDYKPSTPLNPFRGLSGPADLTYRGMDHRDGQRVHHLSVLPWLGGDLTLLTEQGWTGVKIDYALTTLMVNDQGEPISMDFTGAVSGRYQGAVASAAFEVNYLFTKIGEAVEIPSPS
jgi:hypothetical protein